MKTNQYTVMKVVKKHKLSIFLFIFTLIGSSYVGTRIKEHRNIVEVPVQTNIQIP